MEEMEEIIYQVWAKLDEKLGIVAVNSTAHMKIEEFKAEGYVYIDEGVNGDCYGHAQGNYFRMKYGKSMFVDNFRPRFKYIFDTVLEMTEEEIEEQYPIIPPVRVPTEQEKINAELMIQIAKLAASTKVGG